MLLFEQRDRLVATIKFIYAGIYNLKAKTKKGDCKLEVNLKAKTKKADCKLEVTGS